MLWHCKLCLNVALLPNFDAHISCGMRSCAGSMRAWTNREDCGPGARNAFPPPFLAVLRHVGVKEAVEIAVVLHHAGFRMISVTADTEGYQEIMHDLSDSSALSGVVLGASSVSDPRQVDAAFECGARFISSRSFSVEVVNRTKELDLVSIPGVSDVAQALAATEAGADILKIFPANQVSSAALAGIVRVVSYPAVAKPVIVAGGIQAGNLAAYSGAGATGFAVGKTLFEPQMSKSDVYIRARRIIQEARSLRWAQDDLIS